MVRHCYPAIEYLPFSTAASGHEHGFVRLAKTSPKLVFYFSLLSMLLAIMTSIEFVLSPESTVHFYDVLLCLARFSENVCVEANRDKVGLQRKLIAINV